jgi:hypothetical protein
MQIVKLPANVVERCSGSRRHIPSKHKRGY